MNLNHKILTTAHIVISTIMINAQSSTAKLPGDPTLVSSKATLEKLISYDKGNLNIKLKIILQDLKLHNLKSLLTDNIFLTKKKTKT
jgi:hypothetical protein